MRQAASVLRCCYYAVFATDQHELPIAIGGGCLITRSKLLASLFIGLGLGGLLKRSWYVLVPQFPARCSVRNMQRLNAIAW